MHPAPFVNQPPAYMTPGSVRSKGDERYGAGMKAPGRTVAVTGTTSTLAMVSCCAHYLANIVPVLGIAGAFTIVGQYQKELFWVGLVFNALGIIYIGRKVVQFKRKKV